MKNKSPEREGLIIPKLKKKIFCFDQVSQSMEKNTRQIQSSTYLLSGHLRSISYQSTI